MRNIPLSFLKAATLLVLITCGWAVSIAAEVSESTVGRVPVLMYHKISTEPADEPNNTLISLSRFEEQINYLAKNGYTTIDLGELKEFMEGRMSLPEKTVVITFDDGWRSVLNALPILKKHRFKATFFFVLEYLENTYPAFLNWSEISEIASHRDFDIGCHSNTHPWMVGNNLVSWIEGKNENRSIKDVLAEITGPKKVMEDKLLRPILYYSWPSGWYNDKILSIARDAGYMAAVTTDEGMNRSGMDPMKIRRYPVWGQFSVVQFKQLLTSDLVNVEKLLGTVVPTTEPKRDYPVRK